MARWARRCAPGGLQHRQRRIREKNRVKKSITRSNTLSHRSQPHRCLPAEAPATIKNNTHPASGPLGSTACSRWFAAPPGTNTQKNRVKTSISRSRTLSHRIVVCLQNQSSRHDGFVPHSRHSFRPGARDLLGTVRVESRSRHPSIFFRAGVKSMMRATDVTVRVDRTGIFFRSDMTSCSSCPIRTPPDPLSLQILGAGFLRLPSYKSCPAP